MFIIFHHTYTQLTAEDINKAIKKRVNGNSAGFDILNKGIFLPIMKIIFSLMLDIFQKCIEKQNIPELWKSAREKSVYKKRDPLILINIDQSVSDHIQKNIEAIFYEKA